jgi:hypothetical protein
LAEKYEAGEQRDGGGDEPRGALLGKHAQKRGTGINGHAVAFQIELSLRAWLSAGGDQVCGL